MAAMGLPEMLFKHQKGRQIVEKDYYYNEMYLLAY